MKKFLLQITFLIFIPTILLVSICEWSMRCIPNDYSYKDEWMTKNASTIEILNFGSSHGFYGIRPEFFSRPAYNLAFVSQCIKYDYFLYNKYISYCDSLRYVILPVSYFSLRGQLESGIEDWRVKFYCIYMGCDYHKLEWKYNMEISDKAKLRDIIPSWIHNISYISCNERGWGMHVINHRDSTWYLQGPIAAKRHTTADTTHVIENIQRIESIIQDCQKRGIQVILLTTPTYHTYYDCLEKEEYTQMTATCAHLEQKYYNVIYLNWLKNKDFTEDDFFDADHLNKYGAKKLTIMLDSCIIGERLYHQANSIQ